MKILFFIITLSVFSTGFAWDVKELSEEVVVDSDAEMTISVLEFLSKDGSVVKFKPENEPYVLANVRKEVVDGVEYFISIWANGASSTMIRIFRPDISNLPICQESSDSEDSKLRLKNKIIELNISKRKNSGLKDSWVKCFDLGAIKIKDVEKKN
jgi:hypothetical protein